MNFLSSSRFYLIATFFTGSCGLIYQVVWQRYLSIMVGAEAKSTALVIALFLLGLASGYYYWGKHTKGNLKRKDLLRLYGILEFGIGAWGLLFPFLFSKILVLSHMLPNLFLIDIFLAGLLVVPPTFLMGATVPILTAALPKDEKEVNLLHSKIYGLNTIGAFLGVFIGAFYLIPSFGISITTTVAGIINILLALCFVINQFPGSIKKVDDIPQIKNNFSRFYIYALVLVSGIATISMEIICIKIWNLTIGPNYFVFPLVLGLFVLGLGMGSLSLKKITIAGLYWDLFLAALFLMISYSVTDYLPVWVNSLKISFKSHWFSFYPFMLLVFTIMALFILPFVYRLGRILPYAYALLNKSKDDYGEQCGILYFVNTIGTFAGSIIFAHLLFYFVDMPFVFKMNIFLVMGCLMFGLYFDNKKVLSTVPIIISIVFSATVNWNRVNHKIGIYRNKEALPFHFKSPFFLPKESQFFTNLIFFEDGVNDTVSVTEYDVGEKNRSIVVNGKSDSNTAGDAATLSLFSIIPYLYSPQEKDIKSVVVGLGTGVTAGLLASFKDVSLVDVVEISPSVIKAKDYFDDYNFGMNTNEKVKIHEIDAFKFFKDKEDYNLIISEPSNPWVVGVENLFSPSFYKAIDKSLDKNGIFVQWFQYYGISKYVFLTGIKNVFNQFSFVDVYLSQKGDMMIVASNNKLKKSKLFESRSLENNIQNVLKNLKIPHVEHLELLKLFSKKDLEVMLKINDSAQHTLEFPIMNFEGSRDFFFGAGVKIDELINPYLGRLYRKPGNTAGGLLSGLRSWYNELAEQCSPSEASFVPVPLCDRHKKTFQALTYYFNSQDIKTKTYAYSILRNENLIPVNEKFLDYSIQLILEKKLSTTLEYSKIIFEELMKEGLFQKARIFNLKLLKSKYIDEKIFKLRNTISDKRKNQATILK